MTEISERVATSIPPLTAGSNPARWLADWKREMREAIAPKDFAADLSAAAAVACIALPLSMAIALASDVDPRRGLVTAIVGGLVASLAASSRLSVSGPAAAMAVLVGQVVDAHGLGGLFVVTCFAGLLQIATGLLGLGVITRLVPASVVHGFTAGIGFVILVGQLPRALGLDAPTESHAFSVLAHVGTYLHRTNPIAVLLAALVAIPMIVGPRFAPRIPFALVGVVAATAIAIALRVDTARVGAIPMLGIDALPTVPGLETLPSLVGDAIAVYALGSLESLLSIASLDRLRHGERHDPNHELVGQGLANIASGMFGGIPVTSVIARSALNVQSGAKTRRASFLHALLVALAVFAARPLLAQIPVAALGGVLIAIALRMLDLRHLRTLWKTSRSEALIFVVTATSMIAFDLLAGVQAGLIAACVVALVRLTRASVRISAGANEDPHVVALEGALTFLGAPRLETLARWLHDAPVAPGCLVDVRHLDALDVTAAERLVDALRGFAVRGGRAVVLAPNADVEAKILPWLPNGIEIALTDSDADSKLGRGRRATARRRIAEGLARFHRELKPRISPLLGRLAAGQKPHTMMITCADSRVVPSLITGAGPGEVFVVRNIGALLPPHGSDTLNDEGAALEYAIKVLGVRNIVVCGHARCGAVTALTTGEVPTELEALGHWLEGAKSIAGIEEQPVGDDVDVVARRTAVKQLENLRSYPIVRDGIETGEIQIEAWFYEVEDGDVLRWEGEARGFVSLLSSE